MSAEYKEFNDEIEIDLKKVYLALKKGIKWLIITPFIFGVIAVIYVLFIAKPVYTSEAKILLVGSEDSQSSLLGLASQFGFSLPSSSKGDTYLSIETLPEILKSRSLTNSILFSEFTTDEHTQPKTLFNIIYDSSDIAKGDSSELIFNAQRYIAENVLETKQVKNTSIFSLLVNSPEASLSAQIAVKVIADLEKMQMEFNKSELQSQKEFVSARLSEIEKELYVAESRLKTFREQNLQIDLSPTLLLEQERLQRDLEIQTQIFISLKQQLEQIKIEENKNISSIKVIDEPNIPVKRSKPKRKLIVLLAGFMGILLGGMVSLIKHYNK